MAQGWVNDSVESPPFSARPPACKLVPSWSQCCCQVPGTDNPHTARCRDRKEKPLFLIREGYCSPSPCCSLSHVSLAKTVPEGQSANHASARGLGKVWFAANLSFRLSRNRLTDHTAQRGQTETSRRKRRVLLGGRSAVSAGEALPAAAGAWGRQVQEARNSLVLRHRRQPFSRSCRATPCS